MFPIDKFFVFLQTKEKTLVMFPVDISQEKQTIYL